MVLQEHVPLQNFNTFHFKAQARYYARISTSKALQTLLAHPQVQGLPQLVLGSGSNVLFLGDFTGLVLHMAVGGIVTIKENAAHIWLQAGAGVSWHQLVLHCVAKGYAGIENLALIPGTVGAAPVQNIGAYGAALQDVFASLEALEVASGTIRTLGGAACAFGYRDSIFKSTHKGKYIILNVTLKLHKKPTFKTTYGALQATLAARQVTKPSLQAICQAVIHLRQSKLPDPALLGNAGSFFKNPLLPPAQFKQLQAQHPHLPGHAQPSGHIKVPAAWLIEQVGWKGKRKGNVGVHRHHALVLVNHGNGTGQGLYQLAQEIQQAVENQFGLQLVPEVQLVG